MKDTAKIQLLIWPFAIIINKSQGQSLDHVGIYTDRSLYGHGNLPLQDVEQIPISELKEKLKIFQKKFYKKGNYFHYNYYY